ncbi:MAG: hypothetical protein IKU20_03810 [Lachnospiraceae bacterium]|nr:hypothetical protein [Lachnospiraceae bacterium]
MRKQITLLAMLIVCAAVSLAGCKKDKDVDLSGIHTTAVETTPVAESMAPETTAAIKIEAKETTAAGKDASDALSVRSQIATEKNGKVTIEYPILSNLRDEKTTETVNSLIKDYATKLLADYNLNPEKDNVTIACDIISLDRSKAILSFTGSMMPEGAAHPTGLYYTMTVDLSKGTLQGLTDYADAYTMAGYILSDDCIITKAEDKKAAKEYLETITIETLWETLKKCDFTSGSKEFPQSFSYVNEGIIYISVPVPHAIGDYIIVEFHPEGK